MARQKGEVITFKVDEALFHVIQRVPNRSEFIRSAVLRALDSACPLCRGTGTLSPKQKDHWDRFAGDHRVEECGECHEMRLVCGRAKAPARCRSVASRKKDRGALR